MPPNKWSSLWEKQGWDRFPGKPELVDLGRRWLRESASDPSWPYVWEQLFLAFPEDHEYVDVALWWPSIAALATEARGPSCGRPCGTMNRRREELGQLGLAWLQEADGPQHTSWEEVQRRLESMQVSPPNVSGSAEQPIP